MTAAAAIQLALLILPKLQVGVTEFIAWMETLRASLKQAGEWTDEQDQAFEAALLAKKDDPAYQPDPPAA